MARLQALLCLLHGAAALRVQREGEQRNDTRTGQPMLRPGVLHFMFELKDHLQHPSIWGKFFSQGQPGHFMAWAHCTDHHACENDYAMKLIGVRLLPTVFSLRGADLVNPFAHMVRLATAETAHLPAAGVIEKFILLSDSTLPIKPFSFIHWQQTSRPESDICIGATNQWSKAMIDGVPFTMVKHHQWVSLNRRDAQALADDWTPVNRTVWYVTLRSGKWAKHPRRVPHTRFQNGTWFTATDEEAMYERAFGPLQLEHLNDTQPQTKLFNDRRCITYVDWPHNVHPASKLVPFMTHSLDNVTTNLQLLQTESRTGLALLYNVTNEVTLQLMKDETTRFSIGKGTLHPFMIERIGDTGLRVLRKSRYLFARKFSDCVQLPNFTDVMFGE